MILYDTLSFEVKEVMLVPDLEPSTAPESVGRVLRCNTAANIVMESLSIRY
jgi:hypothetical protein